MEILPFHTRQKGIAVTNIFNTFALVINAFVNPIVLQAIAWKYYLVYIVILVIITLVVYLFYAETTDLSLEEISDVFEGPLIVASFFGGGRKKTQRSDGHSEVREVTDDRVKDNTEHRE